jgi:hypothetical protein
MKLDNDSNIDDKDLDEGRNQYRNKTIISMEERLNYLVENDIENEEIYKILKNMAYIYIHQNKYVTGYSGIEDVCHDCASDIWISVLQGRRIKSWMYYIGKMLKLSYITNQRNIEHQIIDTENDSNFKNNIKLMCAGSSMSFTNEFDEMERNLVLENIGDMIRHAMRNIKFKEGTYEYQTLYCNVCINLVKELDNDDITYFRLRDDLKPYVPIIIEQFKKDFRNSGFLESISDNVEDDLEMMITSDEVIMKDLKRG